MPLNGVRVRGSHSCLAPKEDQVSANEARLRTRGNYFQAVFIFSREQQRLPACLSACLAEETDVGDGGWRRRRYGTRVAAGTSSQGPRPKAHGERLKDPGVMEIRR